jgi:hypothetical protein
MGEVFANAPTAGNKARVGLGKEESTRFFGPPPIIAGEDQAQYEAMRDQISAAVGPLDFLEEIWVYDIVNLVWETLRLRRLSAALLHSSTRQRLSKLITTSPDSSRAGKLVTNWASHEPEAVAEVAATLARAGMTIDEVTVEMLALKIDEVERIDRMVAGAEARRNVALREIDRHRATLGAALRQAANAVEDAEFKEIPRSLTEGEAA